MTDRLHSESVVIQVPPVGSARLSIVDFAEPVETTESASLLRIEHGRRPVKMHGANATGESLVTNGAIGADIIRLPAGYGFSPHTHPGHHVLAVLGGRGTITYGGRVYETLAGQIYLVEGLVPHAVGAISDHVILAIGSPHRTVDSPERMTLVEYDAVVSPLGDLHCLICDKRSAMPRLLHDADCPHCPCPACAGA
jgi:quercetin dioxygenase-like cupin family protein